MPQGPNMNQLLKQAQQMQAEMAKAQEQLKNEIVEASAGGGMVKVTMTGDMQLREIAISPEAVDPEDVDMLQDMVAAAVNEALRSAQELAANRMGGIAGGLGGGGLPGLPGCDERRASSARPDHRRGAPRHGHGFRRHRRCVNPHRGEGEEVQGPRRPGHQEELQEAGLAGSRHADLVRRRLRHRLRPVRLRQSRHEHHEHPEREWDHEIEDLRDVEAIPPGPRPSPTCSGGSRGRAASGSVSATRTERSP